MSMGFWTQLDFILAFPLGALMFGLLCASFPISVLAVIGCVALAREASAAHKGWRETYAAWKLLDAWRRQWPPDGPPDDDPEVADPTDDEPAVVDLAAERLKRVA